MAPAARSCRSRQRRTGVPDAGGEEDPKHGVIKPWRSSRHRLGDVITPDRLVNVLAVRRGGALRCGAANGGAAPRRDPRAGVTGDVVLAIGAAASPAQALGWARTPARWPRSCASTCPTTSMTLRYSPSTRRCRGVVAAVVYGLVPGVGRRSLAAGRRTCSRSPTAWPLRSAPRWSSRAARAGAGLLAAGRRRRRSPGADHPGPPRTGRRARIIGAPWGFRASERPWMSRCSCRPIRRRARWAGWWPGAGGGANCELVGGG